MVPALCIPKCIVFYLYDVSFQMIHTLYNLADMLAAQHEGISPTLRDDRLREEAKALEQKYMQKCDSQVGILWFFKHVFEMKISHRSTCCLSELSFIYGTQMVMALKFTLPLLYT